MSRVDVTLCLCLSSGEGPVEVKCSAVCNSGETERRREGGGRERGSSLPSSSSSCLGDNGGIVPRDETLKTNH